MQQLKWLINYTITIPQIKIIKKFVSYDVFMKMRTKYLSVHTKYKIKNLEEANEAMIQLIRSGKPFAAVRNGMGETAFFSKLTQDKVLHTKQAYKQRMAVNFNYANEEMEKYYQLIKNSYYNADITAVWGNIPMEECCIECCKKESIICRSEVFNLYDYFGCWIQELEGKKVLIVSPFVETMQEQYVKRELLHKNKNTLPEFELYAVKAVWWYSGGRDKRFQSWFDVLEYLYEKCMKQKFDIALLSCSTWSTPLAVRLKQAGKQAVQMGAALQSLFGIKGKRWDGEDNLYNEHWVRLSDDTKSGNVDVLDNTKGGAYW